MEMITINNREIPINIVKTNNKNTYYRFKKEGYIQINKSKYQSKKDAVKFIINNKEKFLKKLDQVQSLTQEDTNVYYFLGLKYQKVISNQNQDIRFEDTKVILPKNATDQVINNFEKNKVINILNDLKDKYQNNPYVNIKSITVKTRHMTSRHGSCNAKKRNININTNLIHYHPKFIEYVFLHEISHLVYQNHSKDFYQLFQKLCPNYKELRKELKQIYR